MHIYTHIGLQHQVLTEAANLWELNEDIEDYQQYVVLSFDEIKIKENMVYNSNTDKYCKRMPVCVDDHIVYIILLENLLDLQILVTSIKKLRR